MLLPQHDFGGTGPVLLMLHANSLHGRAYQPLVEQVLKRAFRCIALDLPGHGSCQLEQGQTMSRSLLFDSVYETVCHLGLQGCRAFGHSLGGSVFVNVEALHPGLFSAIYVYEPPLMSALRQNALLEIEKAEGVRTPGPLLSTLARKRRWQWPSAHHALQDLAAKPLFSKWHPASLLAYVKYGTRPQQGPPGPASQGDVLNGDVPVQLSCSPHVEASVFEVMEPPAAADLSKVKCPVAWAISGSDPGLHSRLGKIARMCVPELVQGVLREFPNLTHFGPLESPEGVGQDVVQFFAEVRQGTPPRPAKPVGGGPSPRSKL